ncbi:NAD(P)H-dependent flavin oxidoreductase [Alicyclobacillus fodiniaquatilis]|uniref:Probable nitronate monooxygenase n=1 Tax=Alicyclobacillus fodiniaquatilis TaxID=1661150 RepID=A0ABW4JRV2_9BACL
MLRTKLTEMLQIQNPIIQAGMAGGITTPELVAAVSNAGGLGTLGAGYMSAEQIRLAVTQIRNLTDQPFGVNLFIPEHYQVDRDEIDLANRALDTFRQQLHIPLSPDVTKMAEPFNEQLAAILDLDVPVFSFTFGMPDAAIIAKLKQQDICIIGTATTVQEAILLEQAGVDAVVAQSSEAGGHRGTFAHDAASALIGALAFIPQVADAVSIPVIAAGGVMDGRGLAACLLLGADAVQMGTAFLTCPESGAHPVYKNALAHATEEMTTITKVYSGKAARGLQTTFIRQWSGDESLLPYPIQNALTRDIRQAAAKQNNAEFMSMWAGQGLRLLHAQSAAALVEDVLRTAESLLKKNVATE